jgi:hypothetical protein
MPVFQLKKGDGLAAVQQRNIDAMFPHPIPGPLEVSAGTCEIALLQARPIERNEDGFHDPE